jgi:hypothetical protein
MSCKHNKVQRPHWIVFLIAILGVFHLIYG